MDRAKTLRSQQPAQNPTSVSNQAAKSYPAVTQIKQTPSPVNGSRVLPHHLQLGIEALSGLSMTGTTVHYNSSAPGQIGALAYAAGNNIHLGPGQEQHLPHEAWHVVQQKQGRVKPTLQTKGLAVNDDQALETEADVMGQRAIQLKTTSFVQLASPIIPVPADTDVVQRKIGFEFQAKGKVLVKGIDDEEETLPLKLGTIKDSDIKIEADVGINQQAELEIETPAFEETEEGRKTLIAAIRLIIEFVNNIDNGQVIKSHPYLDWESKNEDSDDDEIDEKLESHEKGIKFDVKRPIKFAPQATVGVKFDNISTLIEALTAAPYKLGRQTPTGEPPVPGIPGATPAPAEVKTTPTKESKTVRDHVNTFGWNSVSAQKKFQESSIEGLRIAKALFPGSNPKPIGLAAVLLGLAYHIHSGFKLKSPNHLKYFMPFLLRNGFLPYYEAMSDVEKKLFNERLRNPSGQPAALLKTDIGKATARTAGKEFTFENILAGLEKGEDILAKDSNLLGHGRIIDGQKRGYTNYRRWDMLSVDDIGYSDREPKPASEEENKVKRHGAIIELRKLGNGVQVEELEGFVLAVFDCIKLINEPAPPSGSTEEIKSSGPPTPAFVSGSEVTRQPTPVSDTRSDSDVTSGASPAPDIGTDAR